MEQAEGIVPLDEGKRVPVIQHGKDKRALHRFSHVLQAVRCEGSLLFNELHRHIAVSLDSGVWQVLLRTQDVVII